jgi:xanthine dehydrogenase accessory factor
VQAHLDEIGRTAPDTLASYVAMARATADRAVVDGRLMPIRARRIMAVLDDAVARVHVHHVPVLPELVLAELPVQTHVLVMTHDHAEDAAIIDAALRAGHLGSIGLIGSAAKWSRFRAKLADEGHDEQTIARVGTPIGIADLTGKEPATIAVSVATSLLQEFERAARSRVSASLEPRPDPALGHQR